MPLVKYFTAWFDGVEESMFRLFEKTVGVLNVMSPAAIAVRSMSDPPCVVEKERRFAPFLFAKTRESSVIPEIEPTPEE